jgi:hypothetical protein
MPSSGMWSCVDIVWTDVSEEHRLRLRSRKIRARETSVNRWLQSTVARLFTQDLHGATSQKTAFFIVTAVKTSNHTYLCMDYSTTLSLLRLDLYSGMSGWYRAGCSRGNSVDLYSVVSVGILALLIQVFRGFHQPLQENSVIVPLLGLDRFFPNPFCLSPYHPLIYWLSLDAKGNF